MKNFYMEHLGKPICFVATYGEIDDNGNIPAISYCEGQVPWLRETATNMDFIIERCSQIDEKDAKELCPDLVKAISDKK